MNRRAAAIWASIPFLAAALVFSGTRSLDFALDDVPLVRDNPAIRDLGRLPTLFGEPYWVTPGEAYGLYRPVAVASFALNRALTGEGPAVFHLGNVLLHAISASLGWFVVSIWNGLWRRLSRGLHFHLLRRLSSRPCAPPPSRRSRSPGNP